MTPKRHFIELKATTIIIIIIIASNLNLTEENDTFPRTKTGAKSNKKIGF